MRAFRSFFWILAASFMASPVYAQTILAPGLEIFMNTQNTGGATMTFHAEHSGSVVWDPDCYITSLTKFTNPTDLVISGDYSGLYKGWDTDDSEGGCPNKLGRATLYTISVSGKDATLDIDCYGNASTGDKYITYDDSADIFLEDGDEVDFINLYDYPKELQPTPPPNFRCTNLQMQQVAPIFAWDAPVQPTGDFTMYYKIFRSKNAGSYSVQASDLTNRSWIDGEVDLNENSPDSYHYYVIAYTKGSWPITGSPDSDPSDIVTINASPAPKRFALGDQMQAKQVDHTCIAIFPNPFNPATTIQYSLAEGAAVSLKVYDLLGREVGSLVDDYQNPGSYNVIWDGHKLNSGIYLCRFQAGGFSKLIKLTLTK
jgi:hypothetical protein